MKNLVREQIEDLIADLDGTEVEVEVEIEGENFTVSVDSTDELDNFIEQVNSEIDLSVEILKLTMGDIEYECSDSDGVDDLISLGDDLTQDKFYLLLQLFKDGCGSDLANSLEFYEENYRGEFSSDEDFAEDLAEALGLFYDCSSETVKKYFDYQKWWDSELQYEFFEIDGHYFSNN